MESRRLQNMALALASGVCFVTNFFTYKYIKKTYDVSKSLYHILALDSGFSTLASIINVINFTFQAFVPESSVFHCTMSLWATSISFLVQPILNAFISLIRYKTVQTNLPIGWKPDPVLIKVANGILIISVSFYTILVFCIGYLDLKWSNNLNVCLHGSEKAGSQSLGGLLTLIPVISALLTSAILDIKSWRILAQTELNNEIPLIASVLSILFTVPYLILVAAISKFLDIDNTTKYFIGSFIAFVLTTFRNPVIVCCAFRVNEVNQQVNLEEDRERRRQIEIQDALKAREERRKLKMMDDQRISYVLERK